MKTLDKIIEILSELSGVKSINLNQNLKDDLGLDSLQMITLLIMLEENFNIVLDESDMNPFTLINVCSVVNLVKKYVGSEDDE